jgi:hypothetical protein
MCDITGPLPTSPYVPFYTATPIDICIPGHTDRATTTAGVTSFRRYSSYLLPRPRSFAPAETKSGPRDPRRFSPIVGSRRRNTRQLTVLGTRGDGAEGCDALGRRARAGARKNGMQASGLRAGTCGWRCRRTGAVWTSFTWLRCCCHPTLNQRKTKHDYMNS